MTQNTYVNPVYAGACPDPFVLKHAGEYWCYCTGIWEDGRAFGILNSPDLVHWRGVGGALDLFASLDPLPDAPSCYWAPEVTYYNGQFYLYYSIGNEDHMQIRVALSQNPAGPFIDSGRRLTKEDFAIDPHIYQDNDGAWYMFYATDYLNVHRVGTGTTRDLLLDPFTLAGQPRPVTRAQFDWQIYDPNRAEKGGVRWHTIEGPFVLQRKGRYYQMFSGGNWQNSTYGVSYALSFRLDDPEEWDQAADGEQVLPILRTSPDRSVIGPGHNSVVRGPDNRQLYCVYHCWLPQFRPEVGARIPGAECDELQESGKQIEPVRTMAIDRLEWVGERLEVLGPSTDPQPAPNRPTFSAFHRGDADHEAGLGEPWICRGGRWSLHGGQAVQEDTRPGQMSEARLDLPASSFLLEVSLQALSASQRLPGSFGLILDGDPGELLNLAVLPRTGNRGTVTGLLSYGPIETRRELTLALPEGFSPAALHTFRVEVDGNLARVALDEMEAWEGWLEAPPRRLSLFTQGMAAAFQGVELTVGWEDLFLMPPKSPNPAPDGPLATIGWRVGGASSTGALEWELMDRQLWHQGSDEEPAWLVKGEPLTDYELVVNVRLDEETDPGGGYGFFPAAPVQGNVPDRSVDLGPLVKLVRRDAGWELAARSDSGADESFPIPDSFDPYLYQQFRFRKAAGRIEFSWGKTPLGEIPVAMSATRVGLYSHKAVTSFDQVRVTSLSTFSRVP